MRGHRGGQKTEWFSRLRIGAGRRTRAQRPPALVAQVQPGRISSFSRILTAIKFRFLTAPLFAQLPARSATDSKADPPGRSAASSAANPPFDGGSPNSFERSAGAPSREYEQAQQENLEADTRLKKLQVQALEDEHQLLPLKRREYELNIELAEIKRGFTLAGIVVVGAVLISELVLGLTDLSINKVPPDLLELCKSLLSK